MNLHGSTAYAVEAWSMEQCCNYSTELEAAMGKQIAIDFDGTCVIDAYPKVGRTNPGAVQVLTTLHLAGAQFCLWTCRRGEDLKAAVDWFWENKIPLLGVNYNPNETFYKEDFDVSIYDARANIKLFCDFYIDDRALGTPMYVTTNGTKAVDWNVLFFSHILPNMRKAQ